MKTMEELLGVKPQIQRPLQNPARRSVSFSFLFFLRYSAINSG